MKTETKTIQASSVECLISPMSVGEIKSHVDSDGYIRRYEL